MLRCSDTKLFKYPEQTLLLVVEVAELVVKVPEKLKEKMSSSSTGLFTMTRLIKNLCNLVVTVKGKVFMYSGLIWL